MHDPMTVSFEIPSPVPQRAAIPFRNSRWFGPVHKSHWRPPPQADPDAARAWRWWRPWSGWRVSRFWWVGRRCYWLRPLITFWHVEPNNRDSRPPCGTKRWRWHLHHYEIQFHPWQRFRHRFVRCAECGRRMNKATRIGHWGDDGRTWHMECEALTHLRCARADDENLIRQLFAAYRIAADMDEAEALERFRKLRDAPGSFASGFRGHVRLESILGWERDENYRLTRKGAA